MNSRHHSYHSSPPPRLWQRPPLATPRDRAERAERAALAAAALADPRRHAPRAPRRGGRDRARARLNEAAAGHPLLLRAAAVELDAASRLALGLAWGGVGAACCLDSVRRAQEDGSPPVETAVRALGTTRAYVEAHGRGYKSASDGERDAFEAENEAAFDALEEVLTGKPSGGAA